LGSLAQNGKQRAVRDDKQAASLSSLRATFGNRVYQISLFPVEPAFRKYLEEADFTQNRA
jgi:hypothetical protein